MTHTALLTISSLLSILFMTFHLADDILFGMSPAGLPNLIGVAILVAWLYGAVARAGQRAGYAVALLGSLFGLAVPVIHMNGTGGLIGGEIGRSGDAFFFVWTSLALAVTATFSAVLSGHALWRGAWRGSGTGPDVGA